MAALAALLVLLFTVCYLQQVTQSSSYSKIITASLSASADDAGDHRAEVYEFPDGRVSASSDTVDCSHWRSAARWAVCQVGPLAPQPSSCSVLAVESEAPGPANRLARTLACRLTVTRVGADCAPPATASPAAGVDILLAGSGPPAWACLAAAMRNGWLASVRQLVLDSAMSGEAASLLGSLRERRFRRWQRRDRPHQLHFINLDALRQPPRPPTARLPPAAADEVALLPSFRLSELEQQILESLQADGSNATAASIGLEAVYFHQIRWNHSRCDRSQRIGFAKDGGWDVCVSRPFGLVPSTVAGCLAFSFGINHVYGYDDELADRYNCTVRMFDPSMGDTPDQRIGGRRQWFYRRGLAGRTGSYGDWQLHTLCSLLDEFAPPGQAIDVLKIDIELWEWPSLDAALAHGCLGRVKQLLFESHATLPDMPMPDYANYLRVWLGLLRAGFRMWKWHENPLSHAYPSLSGSGDSLPCCHEHYMINWNFV